MRKTLWISVPGLLVAMGLFSSFEGQAADLGCCRVSKFQDGTIVIVSCENLTQEDCLKKPVEVGMCLGFRVDALCDEESRCVSKKALVSKDSPLILQAAPQCVADLEQPTCIRTVTRTGPPAEIDIKVQDTGSGLEEIFVVLAENAAVPIPPFSVGTHDPVIVTATKLDQSKSSRVELKVVDLNGNTTFCDPVLTLVVRGTGKPTSESYPHLGENEDTVTVDNGAPGLRRLTVVVNGQTFKITGLQDGESRTIDVSSAMLPGNVNIVTLKSQGKPGTSATVLIWDGQGESPDH